MTTAYLPATGVLRAFLVCLVLSATLNLAQAQLKPSEWNPAAARQSWQPLGQKGPLAASWKLKECHLTQQGLHQEQALLQLQNTGNEPVEIRFRLLHYYDVNGEVNTNAHHPATGEAYFRFQLAPGQTLSPGCGVGDQHKGLRLIYRFLDGAHPMQLTQFELADVTVSQH